MRVLCTLLVNVPDQFWTEGLILVGRVFLLHPLSEGVCPRKGIELIFCGLIEEVSIRFLLRQSSLLQLLLVRVLLGLRAFGLPFRPCQCILCVCCEQRVLVRFLIGASVPQLLRVLPHGRFLVSVLCGRVFACTCNPSRSTSRASAFMLFCALSRNKLPQRNVPTFCALSHKRLCVRTLNICPTVINIATSNYSSRR